MPSRRDLVRMSDAEVRAFLEGQRRIVLVTIGADGMPHPVPMNYGIDEEGRILLTSFAKGQKVKNLERDPRATLLVETGETYNQLKAVIAWCDVEIVRDPDEVARLMRGIRAAEPLAESIDPARQEQVRASLAKRVVLRCTARRVASWDHGRLGSAY